MGVKTDDEKPKYRRYQVYKRWVVDNPGIGVSHGDWMFVGETYAPSKAKALTNVNWRTGNKGFYDYDLGHDMSGWYEWEVRGGDDKPRNVSREDVNTAKTTSVSSNSVNNPDLNDFLMRAFSSKKK